MANNVILEQHLRAALSGAKNYIEQKTASDADITAMLDNIFGNSGDQQSTSDYSQYLIVDSPFNEDLTDNCSVVWNPAGTVSVSDGAANFNKTYLRSNEPVTFGGQDFTISFYANMDSSSAGYCAPFSAAASLSNARLGEIDLRRDNTASSFSTEVFNGSGSFLGSVTLSNLIGALRHFELNYSHDDSALKYFIDGELKATQTCSIERLARYIFLGTNNYTLSASIVGTISHFQIYDGVAIHSENFTPK